MADNKVIISIEAQNAEKAKQALKDLGIEAKTMGDKLKSSADGTDILTKAWQALGITISAAAVIGFMKDSIKAASEQEDALVRLANALKIQGTYTDDLAKRYQELAQSLMSSTRYSDEAIEGMMQRLVVVGNIGPAAMEKVTRATLDLAAANKIDLASAGEIMAKVHEGITRGLKQFGITIEETLPKAKKYEEALKQINEKFGGSAQADVNTFSGSLAQLGNSYGELKEKIGKALIEQGNLNYVFKFWTDVLDNATGGTIKNVSALEQLDDQLKKVTEESNRLGSIIATEGNMHLEYNGILMEANEALERNEAVRIRLIEQIHNQMDAEAELGTISVGGTADPEVANEIVTQQQAALESLKALWAAYDTENTSHQLKSIQTQTEKYNFMIDTQKKANTSLWTEAGKMRDTFSKGISDMTMDWIKGDLDVKKSFEAIGEQMLKVLIDWAVQTMINQALSAAMKAAEIATAKFTGSAVAEAWAPAAAMVSLASFGSNAVPAASAIASTNMLALSFAKAEKGGIIPGSPEGTLVIAGEKNKREAIIPLESSPGIGFGRGDNYFHFEIYNPTGKIDPELMELIVEEVSYVINRDSER